MEIPEELFRNPRVVRITRGMMGKLILVRGVTLPLVALGIVAMGWWLMVICWAGFGVDHAAAGGGATQKGAIVRTLGSGTSSYSKTLAKGESPWQDVAIVGVTALMMATVSGFAWAFCFTLPRRRKQLYLRGEAVTGEITCKQRGLNGKIIAYSLIYEFTTIDGELRRGNLVLRRPVWDKATEGEAIVLYDIDCPERNVLYAYGGYRCEG